MGLFSRSRPSEERPTLPAVISETFESAVLEASNNHPVIVDFWAPWCRPCLAMTPVIYELADRFADSLEVFGIDTQDQPELAAELQVLSLPLLRVYRNGQVYAELAGAHPKNRLQEFFTEAIREKS